jgi:thiol:disulfide interchange protein DsbD
MTAMSPLHKKSTWVLLLLMGLSVSSTSLSATEPGLIKNLLGKKSVEPLPPEQAFQVAARWVDSSKVSVQFTLKPDYYLYKDKVTLEIKDAPGARLTRVDYPAAVTKQDKSFGPAQVYPKSFEVHGIVTGAEKNPAPITLVARYQGCFETLGVCYPPQISEIKLHSSSNATPGKIPAKAQP